MRSLQRALIPQQTPLSFPVYNNAIFYLSAILNGFYSDVNRNLTFFSILHYFLINAFFRMPFIGKFLLIFLKNLLTTGNFRSKIRTIISKGAMRFILVASFFMWKLFSLKRCTRRASCAATLKTELVLSQHNNFKGGHL